MIGKSRQAAASGIDRRESRARAAFGQGCGVLRHAPTPGSYRHTRYPPPPELAEWVEHFWLESWDVRGCEPQTREVLPHPCVHLVVSHGHSRIFGVQLSRFVRELRDARQILGMKFRAGAFYPFLRKPVSSITNNVIPAQQLFSNVADAEDEVAASRDEREMVEASARFLVAHLPPSDPNVETVGRIVAQIIDDRHLTRVDDLAARCGMHERTLQRLFEQYVGASARWVIKRYRIYEALQLLTSGKPADWSALAQDLGYFDQAHFINDFRHLVGCSPSEYVGER